jgi:hypothetical protein
MIPDLRGGVCPESCAIDAVLAFATAGFVNGKQTKNTLSSLKMFVMSYHR